MLFRSGRDNCITPCGLFCHVIRKYFRVRDKTAKCSCSWHLLFFFSHSLVGRRVGRFQLHALVRAHGFSPFRCRWLCSAVEQSCERLRPFCFKLLLLLVNEYRSVFLLHLRQQIAYPESRQTDLNRNIPDYESGTLPIEL